jgi:PAS domain S-box-containing protein
MSLTSRTILIVDDSPEDRELYRRYLLRDPEYSYTILEATLGQQGLDLWQQHSADAVLLDYRLPDLDGLEFLAHLQSPMQQRCLPVIMVTGQGNEAIAVQAMKAGAQDYLVKEQITLTGLHLAVNGVIETVQLRAQLQQRTEWEQLVAQITQKIHQTLDLEEILQTTVTEVRQFLQTDRVFIYRFQPDFSGIVVVESVGNNCLPILNAKVEDHYFVETRGEDYRQGRIQVIPDIYTAGLTQCHFELLARFQIRANLAVPILHGEALWGLLVANHCSAPREWQSLEINLLEQLGVQVGIALQQAELYQQVQSELAERKRTEEALRESQTLFEAFMRYSPATAYIKDEEGRYLYVNPLSERICDRPIYDWLGKTDFELFSPQEAQQWWQNDQAALAANQAIEVVETYRGANGERYLLSYKFPIQLSPDQRLIAGLSLDITDRKRTELERDHLLERERAARAEAEHANRVKDEFLAILSHELRSPLTPILAWAQLLQTRKLNSSKTAEALATIERYAKLQTQLIDDLLDIAKILRGKLNINVTPVNLAFVIEAAIDTVKATAVAKSVSIHSVLSPIGPISGDAVRLQQIVWNLLSNAIKFTPSGGTVEVRLEQVGIKNEELSMEHENGHSVPNPQFSVPNSQFSSYAQITVTDTGKGINPNFLPHIFESFQQEDASTTREYGGLGLGLAIARHLVEAHGGTIWAESAGEDQGATFTVRLPLLASKPESHQSDQSSKPKLDLTGIRVLTVDDDPDTRELITVLLTQYGADVLTVASATEALKNLELFQPDVLISDIGMPEVDGYSLIQQVRALPLKKGEQIPAIALTAYAREEDHQHVLTSGYQWHITKPFDPEQVVRVVMVLVRQSTP